MAPAMRFAQGWRVANLRGLLLSMVLGVLLAGAASAQKVTLDYDKKTDFSKFKTYAWVDGTPARQQIWHHCIVGAFDEELKAKGLKPAPADQADLLIAYHVAVDTDLNVADLYMPSVTYSSGPTSLAYYSTAMQSGSVGRWIKKGTMMVDVVVRERKEVVWRALSALTLKETNAKRIKQVNELITKVMEKYPPPREKN
jgi:hypothetical protein